MQKFSWLAVVFALTCGLLVQSSAAAETTAVPVGPERFAAAKQCVDPEGMPCLTARKRARQFRKGKLGRTVHKKGWPTKTRRKILAAARRQGYIKTSPVVLNGAVHYRVLARDSSDWWHGFVNALDCVAPG